MDELRRLATQLDKECTSKMAYTKKSYKHRKEILILSYIRNNVKNGDIFYNVGLQGYIQKLEFKKCLDTGILFWNETFNKEEIYSPLEFLILTKED